jgi:hypothetical protein
MSAPQRKRSAGDVHTSRELESFTEKKLAIQDVLVIERILAEAQNFVPPCSSAVAPEITV